MKNVPTSLSNLKKKVDKLDVDKLVSVPVDLSKLSDAVKKMYIPNVSNLVKRTDYNTKISEIENKATTDLDHENFT